MKAELIKSLVTLSLAIPASIASAGFETMIQCENGAVRLEVLGEERRVLQLVIQGVDMLTRVSQSFPLNLRFGQMEAVIPGRPAEIRQTSPTTSGIFDLPGVFYPSDFRKMQSTSLIQVERRDSEHLAIQGYNYREGERCDGFRDSEGRCIGNLTQHSTFVFNRGEYVFQGCQNAF